MIEFLSPSALSEMEKANAELVKMVANVKSVQTEMAKINTPSGGDASVKQLTAQYKAQQTTIESLKKQLLDLAKERVNENNQIREIVLSKRELQKQIDLEIKANLQVIGLYGKVNAELNVLKNSYRDLAIKKELGEQLSKKEQASLTTSFDKLTKYDQALKKVDASMGIHGRSVGNYASGFNPLSNSISQITRELPNFGQSMQIGILSLTNNIGAFQDAITGIKQQNKILQAEGQATKSVFSQVGAAFMSWNTLLYVGIGLLSAYGKEIGDWVSSLFDGSKALKELNERQKEFNNSRLTGRKDAQAEILEVRKYLAVLNDRKLSDEQRKIAQDAILKQYPYYIKSVQDAMLVDGKYSKGINELITALEKRKEVEKASELNVTNRQALIDLENERKILEARIPLLQKNFEAAKKTRGEAGMAGVYASALSSLSSAQSDLKRINKEYQAIQTKTIENDEIIIQLKKETIGLEYQEAKIRGNKQEERTRLNYAEAESLYNLKIARLEEQRLEAESQMNNKDATDYGRLQARKEFSRLSLEILDEQYSKEKAISDLKFKEDLDKANEIYKKNKENGYNDVQNSQEWAKAIEDINNRHNNEIELSNINHSKRFKDLMYSDAAFNEKILKESYEKEKKLRDKTYDETNKLNELINKAEQKKYQKIANNEKLTLKTRQEAFQAYQDLALRQLDVQKTLELSKSDPTEYEGIIQKYKELKDAITELESPLDKANEKTKAFIEGFQTEQLTNALKSFGLESAKMFLDFDANGQSTFSKLLEGAKTTQEQFAVTFGAISEVAQEAFNTIANASQKNFEAEYNRLEEQKNIAIAFAGDSTSAKAEIERQYEQKRKEVARREAKAKKAQALVNIGIDTAQAIVATLAKTPLPLGLPFVIATAALGAAQLAMVASQQIPEYWKGTDNAEGGLAWTQERGREIITDSQGRVKSTGSDKGAELTMLSKGDKVFTAEKSAMMFDNSLNSMLLNNGVVMPKIEVSMDAERITSEIKSLANTIASKESFSIVRDAKGERIYQRNQNERKELLNNILNVRTYGV